MQPRKFITTLLFAWNNIDFFIKIQVLYILCYCCYLFILLIKWILQNFYEFQRRETLATNRIVENNKKKARERSLEENPKVDSVFTTSTDSPECLQILINCFQNVEKSVKEIHEMQEKTQSSQIKGELQLKGLSEAVELITKKFDQYETEKKEKENYK